MHPLVFVIAPLVAMVLAVAYEVTRSWRIVRRETVAARDRGFFDGELERQLAERREAEGDWGWPS